MRIAQVSPLIESVPPKTYGGTERVVSWLTEELVRQGHDVTLFASGDSQTSARLVGCWPTSLRLTEPPVDCYIPHLLMLEQVRDRAAEFDVIHFHVDFLSYPLFRNEPVPHVSTLHGRLDLPELQPLYDRYCDAPVVSISDSQRSPLPWANWKATVYHGLPLDLFQPSTSCGGEYLLFLGRISPEKRPDRAIEIARRAGLPLKIGAKVDNVDKAYFQEVIEPLLSTPGVEYLGEVGDTEKNELLCGSAGLLFPIDWPEPFGLVMIEAMACGTPVIAWRNGSVPEVIDDGLTGFIVEEMEGAVDAVHRLHTLDRAAVRARFEEAFTSARMARDYLRLYESLIQRPFEIPSAETGATV